MSGTRRWASGGCFLGAALAVALLGGEARAQEVPAGEEVAMVVRHDPRPAPEAAREPEVVEPVAPRREVPRSPSCEMETGTTFVVPASAVPAGRRCWAPRPPRCTPPPCQPRPCRPRCR